MAEVAANPGEHAGQEVTLIPGPLQSLSGWAHVALVGITLLTQVTTVEPNVNIVLTATLAIWAGAHRSLKPTQMAETMTQGDAMRFPLVGSCVLFGLFLLFKFLPKDLVNMVLTAYFLMLGVVALTATLLPFVEKCFSERVVTRQLHFGRVKIPVLLPEATDLDASVPTIISGVISGVFCAWYVAKKHYIANNILGLAFSIQAIEFLSVGSVQIGAILLCGLFVYDVFWVFCTPVMVTVAKSFDAPIKLLFPRALDLAATDRPFSMLGLGDIVVPGIFLAILLRFDNQRLKADPTRKGARKGYFHTAVVGYVVGLATTIAVMNVFKAAQPALLYIVPAVLFAVMGRCLWLKDTKELLAYDENNDSSTDPPAVDGKPAKSE